MRRVGIFLSVFDVHESCPIAGRITYREHRDGLCLDARSPECPEKTSR
jgi:phosphatidylserine decarboxylase